MINVPYSNAVGSLIYSMVSTRPDLSFVMSVLSRFISNPGKYHWEAMKWLLRYVKGTTNLGLVYEKKNGTKHGLEGFVDSDYAGNKDNRRSTTSYCFYLNGCCISWKTQLQPIVALSTTKAEYIATTEALKEALWLQGLLHELNVMEEKAIVYTDNQSALHLCKNPIFHERTKHVDIGYHFIREKITDGIIIIEKISTEDNLADAETKVVTLSKFKICLNLLKIGTF
ncbi:hypothetical protein UlMin_041916 [Ulmus minor]